MRRESRRYFYKPLWRTRYLTVAVVAAFLGFHSIGLAGVDLQPGKSMDGTRLRELTTVDVNQDLTEPLSLDGSQAAFGTLNWCVLLGYLLILIGVGFYFSKREATSEDFFLASGRVPWWAAGLSIFATQLSAITYLAIPAKSFGTNWSHFLVNMGIPIVAVIVAYWYLPKFRTVKAASAYEFLERRFHVSIRMFGSTSFILFQLGRMGIVVLLPALALSAVTGINVYGCIILMGVLSTAYTYLGGIEAVIWTDVVQVIVLVGGAVAALIIMVSATDGGLQQILATAADAGKLDLANSYALTEWSKDGLLVILLGALFNNLLPYTSDQAVLQRYLTVKDEQAARQAILTNGFLTIPASILFFFVGTALWVFYREYPHRLVELKQDDQLFPWFIAQEMPAGLAGLVIAGVFAAAMSSLDSSMHSIATAVTADFYERWGAEKSSKKSLQFARFLTVALGILGTVSAAIMANIEIKYMWDFYLSIVGLLLGTLGGLFLLGVFVPRVTTRHAWAGAAASVVVLASCDFLTEMHGLLSGAVAVCSCTFVAIVASYIVPSRAANG